MSKRQIKINKYKLDINKELLIGLGIIFVVALWAFMHFYYANPTTVFNRFLSNTLNTSGYTKTIYTSTSTQSSTQVVTVRTGAINKVVDNQTLSVPYFPAGYIKILSIGTPNADYSKYTAISTEARDQHGTLVNYSPALGLWGKASYGSSTSTNGQVFNNSVLDIVPIANIANPQKTSLLNYLKKHKVYTFSGKAISLNKNGRPELQYDVSINMHYFGDYLYQFARAAGFTQYANYTENALPLTSVRHAVFVIDSYSGQLVSINFSGTKDNYKFSSYGANNTLALPTKYMTTANLEKYIQNLTTK